jgi:hypothetical protein
MLRESRNVAAFFGTLGAIASREREYVAGVHALWSSRLGRPPRRRQPPRDTDEFVIRLAEQPVDRDRRVRRSSCVMVLGQKNTAVGEADRPHVIVLLPEHLNEYRERRCDFVNLVEFDPGHRAVSSEIFASNPTDS